MFRTELNIPRSDIRIAVSDRILTIGSCFADAMANRMAAFKLDTINNPAGILYSPTAIHRFLDLAVFNAGPSEQGYIDGEIVYHYDFHSALSSTSRGGLGEQLWSAISKSHEALKCAGWLVVTYGTAWEYRRRDNGESVANCHKQPGTLFSRHLLSAEEIVTSFHKVVTNLRQVNPALKVILTISPVRHIKDTFEGNSVSKSMLRVACDRIITAHHNVFYFPAYEIMMDDLRDYRFYEPDMIHPSEVAEDYIWQKFSSSWFDDDLLAFIRSWKSIQQALQHRPFNPETRAHIKFLQATLERIEEWSGYVNVDAERGQLRQQLEQLGVAGNTRAR